MKQKNKMNRAVAQFRQWSNKRYAVFNSLHRSIKICTLALAYSLVSKPVTVKAESADTLQIKNQEIDDVVVVSSLLELKNFQTGRSVEIVQPTQIQSSPATSIDDLLRYIPGVESQTRGAFGSQTDFSIRGSNFNQVLVLIDGHPISEPLTAHYNSNLPITPSEIDHIEVIKGPASGEYGADAMGGVIHFISKTFAKNQQAKNLQAEIKALGGQHALLQTNAGGYFQTDRWRFAAGGFINKSDGNKLSSGLYNFFDNRTYSFSTRYNLSDKWSLAYRGAIDDRHFNAQYYYWANMQDSAEETLSRQRHHAQLCRASDAYTTTISGSYLNTNDIYKTNSIYPKNDQTTEVAALKINQQWTVNDKIRLAAGTDVDLRRIESNNRGNHGTYKYAIYLLASIRPTDKLSVNTSVRNEKHEKYGNHLLPQLSLAYKIIDNINGRLAAARAIRMPDFTELYYNKLRQNVPVNSRMGNPELKVEKSWNTEVGVDFFLERLANISITGFYRETKGLIDYVNILSSEVPFLTNLLPNTTYNVALNNSTTKTSGLETNISRKVSLNSKSYIQVLAGYTWLHVDASFEKNALPYYLGNHAKHNLNGTATIRLSNLQIEVNGLYRIRDAKYEAAINRYMAGGYALFNTSTSYAFYKERISAIVQINNILDRKYSDFPGVDAPGRWIAAGLRIKLEN
ncbi:MAG TPA: TonB-dependent receptor [Bacteroidales bacterium]|nr:TonB-dependent receptor [Bacteroidales bacterium]